MLDYLYPKSPEVTYGYYTYQAATQETNEDAVGYGCGKLGHVLVVADGVGSDERGRTASQMVVNRIVSDVANDALWPPADLALKHSLERANVELVAAQQLAPSLKGMASTCVAALIFGNVLYTAHIGNSRAYLVRGKKMWRLTRDHTLVEDLVDSGQVAYDDALQRPEASVLQRVMGIAVDTEVDLLKEPLTLEVGDRVALCSDGILHMVTEREVARLVRELDPQEACNQILGTAYDRQSKDDATIAVMRFDSLLV